MKTAYFGAVALCAALSGSLYGGVVTVRDHVGGEDPYDPTNGFYLTGTSSLVNAQFDGATWITSPMGTFDLEVDLGTPTFGPSSGFQQFLTYCIEPEEPIGFGLNPSDSIGMIYSVTSLEDAGYSASEADIIRTLWANAFSTSIGDPISAGAFQAILWELQLDDSIDFTGGNFKLNWNQASGVAVINLAEQWISNIQLGLWTSQANLFALQAEGSQNFILPTDVPEPGAVALLGIGLFTGYTRRRVRKV